MFPQFRGLRHRNGAGIVLALAAAALLILFLFYFPIVRHLAVRGSEWTRGNMHSHPILGAMLFLLFSAVSAMFAFASSMVLVPAANEAWGHGVTFLLLWGGWILGACFAYGIGRLASPLLVLMGYEQTMAKYREFVSGRMRFWAVLLFCVAVPSEVPGYLFGGAHYSFAKFLAAIAAAEAVYAFGAVAAGASLAVNNPVFLLAIIVILMLIAGSAGYFLRGLKKPN